MEATARQPGLTVAFQPRDLTDSGRKTSCGYAAAITLDCLPVICQIRQRIFSLAAMSLLVASNASSKEQDAMMRRGRRDRRRARRISPQRHTVGLHDRFFEHHT